MELSELLSKAGSLPDAQQRKVAAILGSLVADAAAQPIHWVYKDEDLAKAVEGINPEFLPKSINTFYTQTTGQQSPYGDLLMVMLESLAASKGFDTKDSTKRTFEAFGPGSPFDNDACNSYDPTGMSDMSMFPIQGKWRNPLLLRFSNLHAEGKKVEDMLEEDLNVDPDNIPRLVPLVALLAGKPNMLETGYDAAAQLQKSDLILTTVMAACRLMERYILDGASADVHSLEKVIEDLKKPDRSFPLPLDRAMAGHLKDVLETRGLDMAEAAKKFGKI